MRYRYLLTKKGSLLTFGGLLCILNLMSASPAHAQSEEMHRFMVFFNDKSGTPYSVDAPLAFLSQRAIDRRNRYQISVTEEDLPVNPTYVSTIASLTVKNEAPSGVQVYYSTRWFNGLLVQCDSAYVPDIKSLSFVRDVWLVALGKRLTPTRSGTPLKDRRISGSANLSTANLTYQAQHNMLGVPAMYKDGHIGEGIWIGVLDGGFIGLQNNSYFDHLFKGNGRVVDAFNYVFNDWNIEKVGNHGRLVLSCMASYSPSSAVPGTAIGATYAFFVTEDGATENRIEEYNWLFAAERADSLGVDVINSSLGYLGHDIDTMSYSYSDLDGRTAVVTRAANLAYARGIVVVTSAGNEGPGGQTIIAPTDGTGVLSAGGVQFNQSIWSGSSRGPASDGRIKPDLLAQGSFVWYDATDRWPVSGTSFASPLLAGFIASLKGLYPNLPPEQMYKLLRQSGTRANNPDNVHGYGIPHYDRLKPSLTGIVLSPTIPAVPDNTPANTEIATLRAEHLRLGNSPAITYRIKNFNADTDTFKVEGDRLKTNKAIDKSILGRSVSIVLEASHPLAGTSTVLTVEKEITIAISDINAPKRLTGITLAPASPKVVDGTPAGTQVASLTATYLGVGDDPAIVFGIKNFNASTDTFKVEGNHLKTNRVIDRSILGRSASVVLEATQTLAGTSTSLTVEKEVRVAIAASKRLTGIALVPASPTVVHGAPIDTQVANLAATHTGLGTSPTITFGIKNFNASTDTFKVEGNRLKTNKVINKSILGSSISIVLIASHTPAGTSTPLTIEKEIRVAISDISTPKRLTGITLEPASPKIVDGASIDTQVANLTATHTGLGTNPTILFTIKNFNANRSIFKMENNQLKTNKRIDKSLLGDEVSLVLVAFHIPSDGGQRMIFEVEISVLIEDKRTPNVLGTDPFEPIQLYPNPFRNSLNIRYPSHVSSRPLDVRVLNSRGSVILQKMSLLSRSRTQSLELGFLPSGLFLLQTRLSNCLPPQACWRTYRIIKE